MKTITKEQLRKLYNKKENINDHNGCALLLVRHFGTQEELEKLEHIRIWHLRRGYILQEEIDVRMEISQKYYKLLFI